MGKKSVLKKMLFLMVASLPLSALGASAECSEKQTFIEQTICDDKELSQLDKQVITAFAEVLVRPTGRNALFLQQRDWLSKLRNTCQDKVCLRREYESRLEALRTLVGRQHIVREAEVCEFRDLKLPPTYAIFAAGAYAGRRLNFKFDKSGHVATQMDAVVHFPSRPVVLLLGAYEPTIWNIRRSPQTRIAGVLVSGIHRQAVAGLDPTVPVLNTSHDNKGPCGYFYVDGSKLEKLNPLSRRLFGREVDLVYPAQAGNVAIGDRLPSDTALLTSESTPPETFYDAGARMAGQAGLDDAVRKGLLRKAIDADADAWTKKVIASSTPARDVPPLAGPDRFKPPRPEIRHGYVVLKPFMFPAGLDDAVSATFFVPKGVPFPGGDLGHANVYDFSSLSCAGRACPH
jgi:uncharacterized protein YecT (DUF1311 family)